MVPPTNLRRKSDIDTVEEIGCRFQVGPNHCSLIRTRAITLPVLGYIQIPVAPPIGIFTAGIKMRQMADFFPRR